MVGESIAQYTIVARLGSGGMGDVYKATDGKLGRSVALKFLKADSNPTPNSRRRFIEEARAASSLDHPNIGTIYEVGESADGHVFIAMAYYEGDTLKGVMKSKTLALEEILDISRQIAEGLAHAHARRVFHRDIKPGNIMVNPDGILKIVDFGLARIESDTDVTMTTGILGTPAYMSPEQAMGAGADHRSDIWAWGAVTYELLTGNPPFIGPNVNAILHAIINVPPVVPSRVRLDVPQWLEELVLRALDKNPGRRIQNISEVAAAIRQRAAAPAPPAPPPSAKETAVTSGTFLTSAAGSGPSLAVLPLRNMNGNPDGDFFCEGLGEEIIAALAQIPGLRVVSRNSSFALKDRGMDPAEIGRTLRVRSILEGSFRRAGNRVRVTSQLISTLDDSVLWSQKYDRDADDVFAIQEEIAQAIAKALHITLGSGADAKAMTPVRRTSQNPQAMELYLTGRYHLNRSSPSELAKAIEAFDQAIRLDDNFALAYSGLADSILIAVYWGIMAPSEAFRRAKAAAVRAVELDDSLAEAHNSMAALMLHFDWTMVEMAEREFKRAIELNPNYGSARFWYSTCVLLTTQRYAEAMEEIAQAVRLDPLSPAIRTAAASVYLCSGDATRALHEARRALDLDPNYIEGSYALATILRVTGKAEESVTILESVREKHGAGYWTLSHLGMAYAAAGRRQQAGQVLAQVLQLPAQSQVGIAWIHLALGQMDEAIECIRMAATSRDQRLRHLACAPHYAPLWNDPRYTELIREFGLDPQHRRHSEDSLSGFRLDKTSY